MSARPCHLMGCTEYGQAGHHHHWLYGHEDTYACRCGAGESRG